MRNLSDAPSTGTLVLVAGRLDTGDPLQDNIHNVTNAAYRLFQAHGYDAERIYYLASDLNLDPDGDHWPDVDAQANRTNLKHAITQWAAGKVGSDRAFTLYLMDHGGYDRFYLNGRSETVTPEDLDLWLDDDGDGIPNEANEGAEAQVRGFGYAGTFPEVTWAPYVARAEVRDLADGEGVIEAEIRDDVKVLSAWAVIYPPSYVPQDPEGVETMVQEDLTTVTLLDTNGDDVFTARFPGFDQVGEYRVVVYAVDEDGLQGTPRSLTVRTGWSVYLPVMVLGR